MRLGPLGLDAEAGNAAADQEEGLAELGAGLFDLAVAPEQVTEAVATGSASWGEGEEGDQRQGLGGSEERLCGGGLGRPPEFGGAEGEELERGFGFCAEGERVRH